MFGTNKVDSRETTKLGTIMYDSPPREQLPRPPPFYMYWYLSSQESRDVGEAETVSFVQM